MPSLEKAFQGRTGTTFRNLSERELLFFFQFPPQFEKSKMLKEILVKELYWCDTLALLLTQIWYFSLFTEILSL